ncbi:MAG: hypothetical protein L6300_11455, partial [Syntrophaceae bacterium]|nr:hypothetical protein [Syntrophaceae bacterium]
MNKWGRFYFPREENRTVPICSNTESQITGLKEMNRNQVGSPNCRETRTKIFDHPGRDTVFLSFKSDELVKSLKSPPPSRG